MIIIKTQKQIDGIRQSSQLAKAALEYTASFIAPGITTQALNDIAHNFITSHGAIPASLGYNGFPRSICTSINDVVCHGIPSAKIKLREGDIINIDITTILDGFYGDVSASYPVGQISQDAQNLLDRVKKSLDLSIQSLKPGKYLNQCVGQVIEPYVNKFGYSVVQELGGHGVGLKFHEDPFVYHYDQGFNDVKLEPGMVFTIEPMVNASKDPRVWLDNDDWTIRTNDGSLSAQYEHTVLITQKGFEILTK